MTVAELLVELAKYPKDIQVGWVNTRDDYEWVEAEALVLEDGKLHLW